ncbi:flagellar hook protein FlgE [Aurantimonas marina]|uniref:flagellar hook protein FlgE n=1 Tax=Aurantimonas marina TaxID=2780508 RepID=UPI0019D06E1B|nr:flagellar hook protein FlgE [Aurantimonas marina]
MSINGVFRTSVSGMNAQANRLSVVSENIANASTNGYKRGTTEFSSLLVANSGNEYNSGAVKTQVRQMISQQGSISASSSASDLAIQGDGFFVVQDAAGRDFYTRAGSFVQRTDAETNKTYLVNAAGYRLTGTSLANARTEAIELPVGKLIAPAATTTAELSLQFPTSATTIADPTKSPANNVADSVFTKKLSLVVYDNVGGQRTLDAYFTKTAGDASTDSTWEVTIYDRAQSTDGGFPYAGTPLTQNIVFDRTSGLPFTPPPAGTLTLSDGTDVTVNFSDLTEYATDFGAKMNADGNPAGVISEFAFTDDGQINGILSTGSVIPLYQMNLARFQSPDQLAASTGNVYSATSTSGTVEIGTPGGNGFGSVLSGAVEQSNVDLATELTDMIEAQRSYSANSKVFQTGSEILDVLVNLKR